jgi:steroid 5-alpha reductase family enzyme
MLGLAIGLAVGLSAAMTLAWVAQRLVGNAGWVDVVWSCATGLAGIAAALVPLGGPPGARQCLVAALAGAWALRLGLHLAQRVAHGPEDARYAGFRRDWGAAYQARMFVFLQIQAAAALLLALVILAAARNPRPGLDGADALAVVVMAAGIAGEAVADRQLHRFRADPQNRGRICETGLWRWSRHPNYFFEWLVWLAYPLLAIRLDGTWPWGWLTLAGPVFMYWLLVHVSGVPPLEAQMRRSRGAAFDAYAARTSVFFPWPPAPRPPAPRPPAPRQRVTRPRVTRPPAPRSPEPQPRVPPSRVPPSRAPEQR